MAGRTLTGLDERVNFEKSRDFFAILSCIRSAMLQHRKSFLKNQNPIKFDRDMTVSIKPSEAGTLDLLVSHRTLTSRQSISTKPSPSPSHAMRVHWGWVNIERSPSSVHSNEIQFHFSQKLVKIWLDFWKSSRFHFFSEFFRHFIHSYHFRLIPRVSAH